MTTLYPSYRVSPEAIHAAAALNELATPLPATARILEIGCGSASRLIMQAHAYPQSIAIGIDIDEQDILQGQQHVAEAGCTNVELFAAGLGDLIAADPGEFDYIIIHQKFSFLGKIEREALLQWSKAHLSSHGVIAIRWMLLPGSAPCVSLGEALRFHLARAGEESDPLETARAMLSFMLITLEEGALKDEALAAEKMDDTTLTLAYLTPADGVCTLDDFTTQAEAAGLQYLGDLLPQYEAGSYYGPDIEQMLSAVSTGASRAMAQQYLDYAVQRRERFTLLCQQHIITTPVAPNFSHLKKLHWAGCFIPAEYHAEKAPHLFRTSNGKLIRSDNGLIIRIMELLGSAWPMSLSFEQLVFNCRAPETQDDIQESVLETLKTLFMTSTEGLFWSVSPGPYNAAQNVSLEPIGGLPDARPVADISMMNLWGESVSLTPEEWNYLRHEMHTPNQDGWTHFSTLKMKGLLIGSPEAWKKQVQCYLRAGMLDVLKPQIMFLLLLSVSDKQGGLIGDDMLGTVMADTGVNDTYDHVNAFINKGNFKGARDYARELMDKDPENIHVLRCHSRACVLTFAWDDALTSLCRLMSHYFSSMDIFYDLAMTLQRKREFYAARQIARALLRLNKKNIDYWLILASLHHAYGDMTLAEKCCREIMRFQHPTASSLGWTGIVLSDIHKMAEARYFMEKAVEMSEFNFGHFSNLLFIMSHDATVDPQNLLEKHREFGRRANEWAKGCELKPTLKNTKEPGRKLRIGFVSGDLRHHPVANFLLPCWNAVDRDKFELIAYSTFFISNDSMYQHFRDTSTLWRQVDALSDIELANLIAEDEIDILFDLSGHTAYNRLPVFALRPAPIQITWIGYPGTTGLDQMDYFLLPTTLMHSRVLREQLSENIMFVETRKCFEPHPRCPEIYELPALRNGYITFGSFNRAKKLNDHVLGVWAKIMRAYPQSKLLMGFMADANMVAAMSKRMQSLGITEDRLIFRERVGLDEYLSYHHEIDILLDTFPYTGGTTTHHGAWMGVPTLTLSGPTLPCLQGVDIMSAYKLEQFIATDEQDYINNAVSWGDKIPELAAIRRGMRAKIPVENEAGFNVAATFEKALREAWQIYCSGEAPRELVIAN
ncbi:methyltransferase regulatory domain-containing protein [Enterobacteriaceae bacterium H4N4]|uniref:Methyltransferase regulatory domain-containing protein n=1 Tax=Silvania confinis TaxID=2926470 RepID=A0A9J6QDY4_9ENTR|nr:methyltransferase regulatory domain-containing protein [Silvania confinis]